VALCGIRHRVAHGLLDLAKRRDVFAGFVVHGGGYRLVQVGGDSGDCDPGGEQEQEDRGTWNVERRTSNVER
jgi:hypothetical protein